MNDNLNDMVNWISTKVPNISMIISLYNKWCYDNYSYEKNKMSTDLHLIIYMQKLTEMDHWLNINDNTIRLLEVNRRKIFVTLEKTCNSYIEQTKNEDPWIN